MSRLGALLVLALAATPALADGEVVSGVEEALLLPPAGAGVEPYRNEGYRLEFADGGVRVRVDTTPLASSAPFAPVSASAPQGLVARQARDVTAGSTTEYEAVSRILSWIRREIDYNLDRAAPQDAEAVILRRSAYCAGTARLAVAMLVAVGIEAREVPGYVFASAPGSRGVVPGFHRWIEVRYADRGWAFSDPLASQHFVPATYLRLGVEGLEQSPVPGQFLERRGRLAAIDLAPGVPEGTRVRANDDRRHAAALVVAIGGSDPAEATLRGESGERRLKIDAGEARFLGLATGSYELKVLRQGRLAAWKSLIFREPVLARLEIPVGAVPVAAGGGE